MDNLKKVYEEVAGAYAALRAAVKVIESSLEPYYKAFAADIIQPCLTLTAR